jgi:hypothetical protein
MDENEVSSAARELDSSPALVSTRTAWTDLLNDRRLSERETGRGSWWEKEKGRGGRKERRDGWGRMSSRELTESRRSGTGLDPLLRRETQRSDPSMARYTSIRSSSPKRTIPGPPPKGYRAHTGPRGLLFEMVQALPAWKDHCKPGVQRHAPIDVGSVMSLCLYPTWLKL